jgi:phenylacetate-coenzyme A ligase PaaK-like adenylate-forming protein
MKTARYGPEDHKRNEDIKELGITDVNTVILNYQTKLLKRCEESLETKSETVLSM